LVKQWLKQVVVCPVDQNDLYGSMLEGLGGGQSAKATADNNDSWLSHLLLHSPQSTATGSRFSLNDSPLQSQIADFLKMDVSSGPGKPKLQRSRAV
jgi:hypothetical protein